MTLEFTRIDEALIEQAAEAIALAERDKLTIITAESCTGGLLAAVLSEAPGAGARLDGGFTVYTKAQKTIALDVPADLLAREGAVNEPVARAMAQGALAHSRSGVAVAITGVAGPTPDEDGNPVGLVHFAVARRGGATLHLRREFGDIGRGAVRYRSVMEALELTKRLISNEPA